MSSLNRVFIIGRLGKDPVFRNTGNNNVCNFSIATSEKYTKDGQSFENTEWHNIVVWGKSAENCSKYLHKGSQAFVEGKLVTRKWNDKQGVTHYSTEIVAQSVQFLDPKQEKQAQYEQTNSTQEYPQSIVEQVPLKDDFDRFADIPF